jgi:hypothetical protein
MTCSERREVQALSVGPAAALALAGAPALRVHGVFPSTVNLEAVGTGRLVSLCGPSGGAYPHSIVLERPEDFRDWRLAGGRPVRLAEGAIHLPAERGTVVVEMGRAERPPARTLPSLPRLGAAHRACALRLAEIQEHAACDLRIDGPWPAGEATAALGARLRGAAGDLGAAARAFAGGGGKEPASLRQAVSGLVGLGAGLTPAGDDFLCGFLAAARSGRPALADALGEAVKENLGRTGSVSAFLLRCAIEGFWPAPLVDLAEALALEREAASLSALGNLCSLGHSSGSDIATGWLSGLESILGRGPPAPLRGADGDQRRPQCA